MSNKKDSIYERIRTVIEEFLEDNPNEFIETVDRHSFQASTFSDHGLSWVEKKIHIYQPDARVYSPFAASTLYGAYMDEFDEWRSSFPQIFKDFDSFQGCLIESKDLRASALHFKSRKDITGWRGRPFSKEGVSLLIIDNTFLRILWSSFYYLIAQQYCPGMDEGKRKTKIWDTWNYRIELDTNHTFSKSELNHLQVVRKSFKEFLVKEYKKSITPQSKLWINELIQPQRDWNEGKRSIKR